MGDNVYTANIINDAIIRIQKDRTADKYTKIEIRFIWSKRMPRIYIRTAPDDLLKWVSTRFLSEQGLDLTKKEDMAIVLPENGSRFSRIGKKFSIQTHTFTTVFVRSPGSSKSVVKPAIQIMTIRPIS